MNKEERIEHSYLLGLSLLCYGVEPLGPGAGSSPKSWPTRSQQLEFGRLVRDPDSPTRPRLAKTFSI